MAAKKEPATSELEITLNPEDLNGPETDEIQDHFDTDYDDLMSLVAGNGSQLFYPVEAGKPPRKIRKLDVLRFVAFLTARRQLASVELEDMRLGWGELAGMMPRDPKAVGSEKPAT